MLVKLAENLYQKTVPLPNNPLRYINVYIITGHSEYDALTLKAEYDRDKAQGLSIRVPANYFPEDDDTKDPLVTWRSHANLLYQNWLNYFVYQTTPYDIAAIPAEKHS